MSEHFVYILTCKDGTLYTGYATDVGRRLAEHQSGKGAKYTRGRTPVRLSFVERAPSRSAALAREAKIKVMSRARKLLLCGRFKESHSSR